MRKFIVTSDTYAKLNSTAQSSDLPLSHKFLIPKDTILHAQNDISDAGDQHLSLSININLFGPHIQEIKPSTTPSSINDSSSIHSKSQAIASILVSKGITNKYAIAAILGHWKQESSLSPYADESKNRKGGTGLGLAQWSFERRNKVPKFTNDYLTDVTNQIDLFIHEMKGGDRETFKRGAWKKLTEAKSLAEAMEGMRDFERYGIAGARETFSQQYLQLLDSHSIII